MLSSVASNLVIRKSMYGLISGSSLGTEIESGCFQELSQDYANKTTGNKRRQLFDETKMIGICG